MGPTASLGLVLPCARTASASSYRPSASRQGRQPSERAGPSGSAMAAMVSDKGRFSLAKAVKASGDRGL